ncbi:MAG: hypothetical protein WC867_04500 [Candidatus Pacearchaeota archaeon]|jgi:predicted nucleic acid-binding protein
MIKKYIIFDAGPLINFAMNGLLPVLKKLKQEFDGDFIITKEVKREIIDYPESTKKYELEALQIKQLFEEGIIKHADLTEKEVNLLREKREELMNTANSTFFSAPNKPIHILDKGESAALALGHILKGPSVIAMDERTGRLLCENPDSLKKLLQNKLHTNITANKKNYDLFKGYKIIRSTELAYLAYKKQLIDIKDPKLLDALLYALKLHGCVITDEEIAEMKKM